MGNPRVDFDLVGFDQVSNPRKRDVALLPMAYPKGLTEHACTALDPLLHLCLAVTQCSGGHQHTIGVSLFLMPLSSWYYRPIYSDIRNGSRSGLGLRLKSESPRQATVQNPSPLGIVQGLSSTRNCLQQISFRSSRAAAPSLGFAVRWALNGGDSVTHRDTAGGSDGMQRESGD